MEYSIGDRLLVDNVTYDVVGKIYYRNCDDSCCWFEYRLIDVASRKEKWLSIDETYREYSISEGVRHCSLDGYHQVDSGTQQVIGRWGSVDVEFGDRARFIEYEDETEELIISSEIWDDGEEVSVGYYLDPEEIQFISSGNTTNVSYGGSFSPKSSRLIVWCVIVAGLFVVLVVKGLFQSNGKSIEKVLKESSYFQYTTSITGAQNQKAQVYKSSLNLDQTVKKIITGIEGNTVDVQQNNEDNDDSVAILTKSEYCLVYQSDDDEVLVQISSRKYAYTSDRKPYKSRSYTHRFYRRYYYSKGYTSDSSTYKGDSSSYTGYSDTPISSNTSDTYNTYSSSVRQASINSRKSSGGGLSSGK